MGIFPEHPEILDTTEKIGRLDGNCGVIGGIVQCCEVGFPVFAIGKFYYFTINGFQICFNDTAVERIYSS